MSVICLLTGRGNNTFPNKNVYLINNKPLLSYTAIEATKSQFINKFYVSSEDEVILNTAAAYGYEPIIRPKTLATPESKHIDVITHALSCIPESPSIVVILLANNPCIKVNWVDDCICLLRDNLQFTSAVPVYKDMDHHPIRAKKIDQNGLLRSYVTNNIESSNREDLIPNYFLCHNFWVIRPFKNDGEHPWVFLGKAVYPYVIDKTVDLHSEADIVGIKEWLLKHSI